MFGKVPPPSPPARLVLLVSVISLTGPWALNAGAGEAFFAGAAVSVAVVSLRLLFIVGRLQVDQDWVDQDWVGQT